MSISNDEFNMLGRSPVGRVTQIEIIDDGVIRSENIRIAFDPDHSQAERPAQDQFYSAPLGEAYQPIGHPIPAGPTNEPGPIGTRGEAGFSVSTADAILVAHNRYRSVAATQVLEAIRPHWHAEGVTPDQIGRMVSRLEQIRTGLVNNLHGATDMATLAPTPADPPPPPLHVDPPTAYTPREADITDPTPQPERRERNIRLRRQSPEA